MIVYLQALGCRLNEAELEQWARRFRDHGWQPQHQPEGADLAVLNTCAVTAEAVRKSRQQIRRLRKSLAPSARLAISGCYASLEGRQQASELGVDLVVDNTDKERLPELAIRDYRANADAAADTDLAPILTPVAVAPPGSAGRRSRAFIKVQDGCRHRCSYCIVTIARGAERSRSVNAIVDEINQLHANGVQEAVISGVHLGGYGADLGSSLTELLATLLRETGIPRLRLGSLEPWDLGDSFLALFANTRLQPHLHLPLQSGSDRILKRMARRGRVDNYRHLAEQARAAIPDLNLSTDFIVGFPGESDEDFAHTEALANELRFSQLHVFPYSARAGTAAAEFPDRVDTATVRRRATTLQALNHQLRAAAIERGIGRRFDVLWEDKRQSLPDGRLRLFGYTPNYLRVATDTDAGVNTPDSHSATRLTGQIVAARLTDMTTGDGAVALAELA